MNTCIGKNARSILKMIVVLLLFLIMKSCKEESGVLIDKSNVFNGCTIPGSKNSLDLITLNVQEFPKDGDKSVSVLAELIKAMNPDVMALQEVSSSTYFSQLDTLLEEWTGFLNPTTSQALDLAYFVKSSDIEIDASSMRLLFTQDRNSFPRAPFEMKIKHRPSGKELYLINVHLKCCSGEVNRLRRQSASVKLDLYIDEFRNNESVVMFGDFNDKIPLTISTDNPFYNFHVQTELYRFADSNIAAGDKDWWSYPSYKSHIDHFLITNELFSSVDTCYTIKPESCYPDYYRIISDHRPVGLKIVFQNNQ